MLGWLHGTQSVQACMNIVAIGTFVIVCFFGFPPVVFRYPEMKATEAKVLKAEKLPL